MKNFRIKMRKVATIVACLAIAVFSGCDPAEDLDNGTGKPEAVTNLTATAGNGQVSLTWNEPSDNGGEEITGYEVTSDNWANKVTKSASEFSHTCTGLTNGTEYTFKVRAVNANGAGAESEAKATPKAGGVTGGGWSKVNTANFSEFYDFIPCGTFIFQEKNADLAYLIAKNADGSLITSKIYKNPSSQSLNQNYEYRIWHEDMYYWVNHDYLYSKPDGWTGAGEITGDLFHTLSLKTPGGTVRNPQRMTVDAPYGGVASATAGDTNPLNLVCPFDKFVNMYDANIRDNAVFEKNEAVAGIPCKKYVYETSSSKSEWWLLDNGCCLKYSTSFAGYSGGFDMLQAELNTPTYDYVTQKYGNFGQVNAIPPVADMIKATEGIQGANWIAPASFLKWTAGGFNIMCNFRALDWEGYPVHQVYIGFPKSTAMPDALSAYRAEIMKIPNMKESSHKGMSGIYDTWEYNNNTDEADGYWSFELRSFYSFGGLDGNPCQIFIWWTKEIEV
jgi:hypothetical protein